MAVKFSRNDIRDVGGNVYQLGSLEFAIMPGASRVGYKNLETDEAGAATPEDIGLEFGNDVGSFFREKLAQ
ncbi:hypothetical protein ACFL2Q_08460 [Thermodesulfobacteriota bacterium]